MNKYLSFINKAFVADLVALAAKILPMKKNVKFLLPICTLFAINHEAVPIAWLKVIRVGILLWLEFVHE